MILIHLSRIWQMNFINSMISININNVVVIIIRILRSFSHI